MTDIALLVGVLLIVSAWWFCIGWWCGRNRERHAWEDETIKRRFAVYHWENGRWYWADEEPQTSRDPAATKVKQLKLREPGTYP